MEPDIRNIRKPVSFTPITNIHLSRLSSFVTRVSINNKITKGRQAKKKETWAGKMYRDRRIQSVKRVKRARR